ncbi:MAG TPA: polysaccharide deacetylase family protein [Pseudolabrys sp.]|nr:polysaccharide deacetylase family protein [Pseudolabrys sp.]
MAGLKKSIIRGGLEGLYFSGMHRILHPLVGGIGAILMLHHVRPPRADPFQPNRLLEVTPDFFEALLRRLKGAALDIISLDAMHERLVRGDFSRRFMCITFDDGYRDVMQWAYPLLEKYDMPFALYIATSFPERLGELWWLALEAVIARNERVTMRFAGEERALDCRGAEQKRTAFDLAYGYLRSLQTEDELRRVIRDLCTSYRVDIASFGRDLCMGWDEIGRMARDPLVTIGAHTVNHVMLKKVPGDAAVRDEMDASRAAIEAAIGRRPEHLAYPVGDPTSAGPREFRIAAELGFKTAVTTRPGVLFADHRNHLTALPRISINGEFQKARYLDVLLSGAATAVWNGFRRVNAA